MKFQFHISLSNYYTIVPLRCCKLLSLSYSISKILTWMWRQKYERGDAMSMISVKNLKISSTKIKTSPLRNRCPKSWIINAIEVAAVITHRWRCRHKAAWQPPQMVTYLTETVIPMLKQTLSRGQYVYRCIFLWEGKVAACKFYCLPYARRIPSCYRCREGLIIFSMW